MAHEGIFATSDECIAKAGTDYDSSGVTEARINDYIAQAESYINVVTRYNWSDAYSTLNVDVKRILSEAASNLTAVYMIQYNMNGFLSIRYAREMIDNLLLRFSECVFQLQDLKRQDFINGA